MQRLQKGDWVRVAKDLGPSMRHFASDCEAIVAGSYADQYGGDDHDKYTVYLKGLGECSWYHDNQLALIETGRLDKLQAWEKEAAAERKRTSDLDWIFTHGPEVLERATEPSIAALASCFGLKNLWGPRGEGTTYCFNALYTLALAEPFLNARDKAGWLEKCEFMKSGQDAPPA